MLHRVHRSDERGGVVLSRLEEPQAAGAEPAQVLLRERFLLLLLLLLEGEGLLLQLLLPLLLRPVDPRVLLDPFRLGLRRAVHLRQVALHLQQEGGAVKRETEDPQDAEICVDDAVVQHPVEGRRRLEGDRLPALDRLHLLHEVRVVLDRLPHVPRQQRVDRQQVARQELRRVGPRLLPEGLGHHDAVGDLLAEVLVPVREEDVKAREADGGEGHVQDHEVLEAHEGADRRGDEDCERGEAGSVVQAVPAVRHLPAVRPVVGREVVQPEQRQERGPEVVDGRQRLVGVRADEARPDPVHHEPLHQVQAGPRDVLGPRVVHLELEGGRHRVAHHHDRHQHVEDVDPAPAREGRVRPHVRVRVLDLEVDAVHDREGAPQARDQQDFVQDEAAVRLDRLQELRLLRLLHGEHGGAEGLPGRARQARDRPSLPAGRGGVLPPLEFHPLQVDRHAHVGHHAVQVVHVGHQRLDQAVQVQRGDAEGRAAGVQGQGLERGAQRGPHVRAVDAGRAVEADERHLGVDVGVHQQEHEALRAGALLVQAAVAARHLLEQVRQGGPLARRQVLEDVLPAVGGRVARGEEEAQERHAGHGAVELGFALQLPLRGHADQLGRVAAAVVGGGPEQVDARLLGLHVPGHGVGRDPEAGVAGRVLPQDARRRLVLEAERRRRRRRRRRRGRRHGRR